MTPDTVSFADLMPMFPYARWRAREVERRRGLTFVEHEGKPAVAFYVRHRRSGMSRAERNRLRRFCNDLWYVRKLPFGVLPMFPPRKPVSPWRTSWTSAPFVFAASVVEVVEKRAEETRAARPSPESER